MLRSDVPDFQADDVKFRAFVAQRLVAECRARARDAVLKARVDPETVVSIAAARFSSVSKALSIVYRKKQNREDDIKYDKNCNSPASDAQKPLLAENHVVVNPAIREGLET